MKQFVLHAKKGTKTISFESDWLSDLEQRAKNLREQDYSVRFFKIRLHELENIVEVGSRVLFRKGFDCGRVTSIDKDYTTATVQADNGETTVYVYDDLSPTPVRAPRSPSEQEPA